MKEVYQVAGISRQAHSKEGISQKKFSIKLQELIINVDALRREHPGCGVQKMYDTLQPHFIGRDRFIEIMMDLGYRIKRPKNYKRTTYAGKIHFANLIEGMILNGKNQLWQSDITYIRLGDRFYYLVLIIDVYTREIVGYALSNHMRAEANVRALKMAFKANPGSLKGLIHHSDRGSQYSSIEYLKALKDKNIIPSMGTKGQENAYAEKLNDTIKNEYVVYRKAQTKEQLEAAVKQAITNYNTKRIHNELPRKQSPRTFAKNLLSLSYPQRPTVIVYAEGKKNIGVVSNYTDVFTHKDLWTPVCPIQFN